MWSMKVIWSISPKESDIHRFIFVVISYFTKWVEAASYVNVTKSTVSKFVKNHMSVWSAKRIISDNVLNLNNSIISKVCSLFTINAISPKKRWRKKKLCRGNAFHLGPSRFCLLKTKFFLSF